MNNTIKRPNSGTQSRLLLKKAPGYLFFLVCSAFFCWLFLCVCAKIMCMADFSQSWRMIFTSISSLAAIFLAAVLYAGKIKNGPVGGILLALGGWLIISVIGSVQQNNFTQFSLLRLFSFFCAGVLGGLLGTAHRQKKVRKKPAKHN